jgi:hypothetical protein
MGPQDPKDVTRDTARDLSGLVGELAALKGDATHWLTDPEYVALRHCLEDAHASGGRARSDRGSACGGAQAGEAEREARRINAPSG